MAVSPEVVEREETAHPVISDYLEGLVRRGFVPRPIAVLINQLPDVNVQREAVTLFLAKQRAEASERSRERNARIRVTSRVAGFAVAGLCAVLIVKNARFFAPEVPSISRLGHVARHHRPIPAVPARPHPAQTSPGAVLLPRLAKASFAAVVRPRPAKIMPAEAVPPRPIETSTVAAVLPRPAKTRPDVTVLPRPDKIVPAGPAIHSTVPNNFVVRSRSTGVLFSWESMGSGYTYSIYSGDDPAMRRLHKAKEGISGTAYTMGIRDAQIAGSWWAISATNEYGGEGALSGAVSSTP